jgi:DnaJ-domain-containing protein 1/Na+-transporting methylmalonyl-CoA/oxaloacetate decarboxylase gamma subunit
VQFEAVIAFVFLVLYMLWAGIKAFFRWVTGEAKREREEEERQRQEQRKQDEERERKEAAERQAKSDAKKQFEQAILNGQFPTNEVLSVLANCDGNWDDIPTNVKEAFEELLWGSCTLRDITYGDAVRLIRQRGRIGERARQRAANVGLPGDDPDRPLGEAEALALLGVAAGCTSEELASAYHLTMSQWHPDKLENMATELKDYATRQTQRINEAYQLIKSTTVQSRASGE